MTVSVIVGKTSAACLFAFGVVLLVFSAMLPSVWHKEKNAANLAYGAPGCIETMLKNVDIDIVDGDELIQPGYYEPEYASPRRYDAFLSEYAAKIAPDALQCHDGGNPGTTVRGANCLADAATTFRFNYEADGTSTAHVNAAAAYCAGDKENSAEQVKNWPNGGIPGVTGGMSTQCANKILKPFFDTSSASKRKIFEDAFEHLETTALPGLRTTTAAPTTTTAADANSNKTFSEAQLGVVFPIYSHHQLSPYLHLEKDKHGKKCEKILSRMKYKISKGEFDLFDENVADLMTCNIMYGWPLGEYCASALDEENEYVFATGAALTDLKPKLTPEIRAAANKICVNATRTKCGNHYIGDKDKFTPRIGTGWNDPGATLFTIADTEEAVLTQAKENPCFMKDGRGKSAYNDGRFFATVAVNANGNANGAAEGPVISGTGMFPSAYSKYYEDLEGSTLEAGFKANHLQDLDSTFTHDANGDNVQKQYKQTVSLAGNPASGYYEYLPSKSDAITGNPDYTDNLNGASVPSFARINIPVTGVDSKMIYERFVYDSFVLAQMASSFDREQDFYNKLPGHCFSSGFDTANHWALVVLFLVSLFLMVLLTVPIILGMCVPRLRENGSSLFPGDADAKMKEGWQYVLLTLSGIFTGIFGFMLAWTYTPDASAVPDDTTPLSDLTHTWASVYTWEPTNTQLGLDLVTSKTNGITAFLADIANGNNHLAYNFTEKTQHNAFLVLLFSGLVFFFSIVLVLLARKPADGGNGGSPAAVAGMLGSWA